MNKKTTDIVAYITWIGLIIAIVAGDMNASKFHINQAMVIWLGALCVSIASTVISLIIPVLGGIVGSLGGVAVLVFAILGLVSAVNGEEKPLPVIGAIKILK